MLNFYASFRDILRIFKLLLNLLILLAESPGKPLSREDLAGIDEPGRAVDVGINRLRKKIEDNPTMPIWLQTVRGKGYILRPN